MAMEGLNSRARRNGEAGGMVHNYFAEISFDGEAGVWYVSDTDFPGLVAEAPTERDLLTSTRAFVPELYEFNRSLFDESGLEGDSATHDLQQAEDNQSGGIVAGYTRTLKQKLRELGCRRVRRGCG